MDFIILDELGYLPFAQSAGQLLFHLVSRRHERTSIIVTTNLAFRRMAERHPEQFGKKQHSIVQRLLRTLRQGGAAQGLIAETPTVRCENVAQLPGAVDGSGYGGPDPPTAPLSVPALSVDHSANVLRPTRLVTFSMRQYVDCAPDGGQIGGWELTGAAGLRRMKAMAKHRTHSTGQIWKPDIQSSSRAVCGETP